MADQRPPSSRTRSLLRTSRAGAAGHAAGSECRRLLRFAEKRSNDALSGSIGYVDAQAGSAVYAAAPARGCQDGDSPAADGGRANGRINVQRTLLVPVGTGRSAQGEGCG